MNILSRGTDGSPLDFIHNTERDRKITVKADRPTNIRHHSITGMIIHIVEKGPHKGLRPSTRYIYHVHFSYI